jgi:transcriptional regulator with XRE-family HTH domain
MTRDVPQEIKTQFGDYLRGLRYQARVTQREAAEGIGISSPYLAQLEKGRRNPPGYPFLHRIALYYQVDETYLLNMAGHQTGKPEGAKTNVSEETKTPDPTTEPVYLYLKVYTDRGAYIKFYLDAKGFLDVTTRTVVPYEKGDMEAVWLTRDQAADLRGRQGLDYVISSHPINPNHVPAEVRLDDAPFKVEYCDDPEGKYGPVYTPMKTGTGPLPKLGPDPKGDAPGEARTRGAEESE